MDVSCGSDGITKIVQHVKACHQVEIPRREIFCLGHLEPDVLGAVRPRVGGSVLNGWCVEIVSLQRLSLGKPWP